MKTTLLEGSGFLGEFPIVLEESIFRDFGPREWALFVIAEYGGHPEASKKAWALDQAARILNGAEVILTQARWRDGMEEYRIRTGESTSEYRNWLNFAKTSTFGRCANRYDEGTPP